MQNTVAALDESGFEEVPEPTRSTKPSTRELLERTPHPVQTISTWSPDFFELFVHEWVFSCVQPKYSKVVWAPGAGDKGRDVRAFVVDEQGEWDNYQCKRYGEKLTPGEIWVELGKLCFYTHLGPKRGGYRMPRRYYFVAQHGVGPSLQDLIENPEEMRKGLKFHWNDKCRAGITKSTAVDLKDALLDHVDTFPFDVISHKTPRELVKDIEATQYYNWYFGYRKLHRPALDHPPATPTSRETAYLSALYDAYAEHLGCSRSDLHSIHLPASTELNSHMRDSRECFYYAEQLLRLGRDKLPPGTDIDLMNQMYHGIMPVVRRQHVDGYECVLAAIERAGSVSLNANELCPEVKVQDRCGMCHQLANDGRVQWVKRPRS